MANLHTPEEIAVEILAIFKHYKCPAGGFLLINNFHAVWNERGLSPEDIKPGIDYAVTHGWVDIQLGRDIAYILTKIGFAKNLTQSSETR